MPVIEFLKLHGFVPALYLTEFNLVRINAFQKGKIDVKHDIVECSVEEALTELHTQIINSKK